MAFNNKKGPDAVICVGKGLQFILEDDGSRLHPGSSYILVGDSDVSPIYHLPAGEYKVYGLKAEGLPDKRGLPQEITVLRSGRGKRWKREINPHLNGGDLRKLDQYNLIQVIEGDLGEEED